MTLADKQRAVLDFVESWVSNPVGAYSIHALDGLFALTRDKINALSAAEYNGTCAYPDEN
jgi:hypothetical protein